MRTLALLALVVAAAPSPARAAAPGPGLSDLQRARSFAMGGAFRALGAGTEAVDGNPASLAVYRRYLIELSGAWDPRNPFGFGSISVMDSVSGALAAGLSYHLVSLGSGDDNRVAHVNTAAFSLPLGQALHIGVSSRHVLMTGAVSANAITADAGILVRLGSFLASVSGRNLIDIHHPEFPRTFAAGLGFASPDASLAVDVGGDFNGEAPQYTFSGGAEWVIGRAFPVRAGYTHDQLGGTRRFVGGGIGILIDGGGLDLGYRHELGGSTSRLLALTLRMQVM